MEKTHEEKREEREEKRRKKEQDKKDASTVEQPWNWQRKRKALRMIVDNEHLQEALCGHAVVEAVQAEGILRSYLRNLSRIRECGWLPPFQIEDPWLWRPRGFNVGADEMCNRTMNSECNIVGFFPHNGTDCSVVHNYLNKGGEHPNQHGWGE